jgi:ubiquinone/menaquinone biosynthesis C-methylase UbiE
MEFYKPEHILNYLDLKDGIVACDFGCGAGHFAISLAKKLPKSRIFGIDDSPERLSFLKSRVQAENLKNIFPFHCDLSNLTFRRNFIDLIVIHRLPFLIENKCCIIKEAKRVLKNNSQCLIIDRPENPKDIKQAARAIGFCLKKEFLAGDYHYGLLFLK